MTATKKSTIPARLRGVEGYDLPKGRCLIILVQNYWGRGDTLADAVAKLREGFGWRFLTKGPIQVIDAPEGAWVDGMGGICWEGKEEYRTRRIFQLEK